MQIYGGLANFGYTENTDGTAHATRFFYFGLPLPLVPVGGVRVERDGSEHRAPLRAKSVAAAYLKWWGLPVGLLASVFGLAFNGWGLGGRLVTTVLAISILTGVVASWLWLGEARRPSRARKALFLIPGLIGLFLTVVLVDHWTDERRREAYLAGEPRR